MNRALDAINVKRPVFLCLEDHHQEKERRTRNEERGKTTADVIICCLSSFFVPSLGGDLSKLPVISC
jgi:hypothetical protein